MQVYGDASKSTHHLFPSVTMYSDGIQSDAAAVTDTDAWRSVWVYPKQWEVSGFQQTRES